MFNVNFKMKYHEGMDTCLSFHNLELLAKHPLHELMVAEDGETLVVRSANSNGNAAALEAIKNVVIATRNFLEKRSCHFWVKLGEEKDALLGLPAQILLQRLQAGNFQPIQPQEYEKHRRVTLVFRNNDGNVEKMEADRDLLLQQGGVFTALLGDNFQEASQKEIVLLDISPTLFREFLAFLEGKEECHEDPNDWVLLLQLGNQLCHDAFIEYSAKNLLSTISLDQVGDILENSKEMFMQLVAQLEKKHVASFVGFKGKWIEAAKQGIAAPHAKPVERAQKIYTAKVALVDFVNKHKLPMREIAKGRSVSEIIDWLQGSHLEYADFSGYQITNDELAKLMHHFPTIKHLAIPNSLVSGDSLSSLLPGLVSVNISFCTKLAPDALKYLPQGLRKLKMKGCTQFEPDALKRLPEELRCLSIAECRQLEQDALQHLHRTPHLKSLNISECFNLSPDTLKDLPKGLLKLNIFGCFQLEHDALKHLPPGLISLSMAACHQFLNDVLTYLKQVPLLRKLDISECTFKDDALKHIPNGLRKLIANACDLLEPDALKYLPPSIQRVKVEDCPQLNPDAVPEVLKGRLEISF